jgi:prepilin signal peptidase PulO-like enzyme (type II secretory pathway)
MFDPITSSSIGRDALAAVLGLCVGSFLNVLALRSVKEESLISPPSTCPNCKHRIAIYDLIPVVSYLILNGKCRHCRAQIHWMYPFVEVFTACTYVVLLHVYGPNFAPYTTFMDFGNLIGMAIFCSTLITITITDFREKLIPHEITYPSMLLGIIYSGVVRNDAQGALIGVGISYMLFDFLAFYGTKFYIQMYGDPDDPDSKHKKILVDRDREGLLVTGPDPDVHIHHTLYSTDTFTGEELISVDEDDDEEFTVMGGGDAVLSAVISAWLGLPALGIALMVGFMTGTVMGALYLFYEMYKAKVLKNCLKPALIGAAIFVVLIEGGLLFMKFISSKSGFEMQLPYLQLGLAAAIGGALLGALRSGHDVSKPFPFGPSLAIGAVVAMATKSMIFPGAP